MEQPRTRDGRYGHVFHTEPNLALGRPSVWPAAEWETLDWAGPADAFRTSNYLSGMHGQSYQAFVPPLIADTGYRPSTSVTALAEDAARQITRFDEAYGRHVEPFAAIMLRTESVASSQIENVTANARSLGEAELGVEDKLNATLVVRNVRAMEAALDASDRMDTDSVLAMHRALMDHTRDAAMAGSWRQEQVWIGTSIASPIGADFVPPAYDRIPALMDDVMFYASRTDVPSMVQAAIAHAQFETIHPFTDGNGRTGRALLHSMLKHRGVATTVSVPVSAGLLADIGAYHRALTKYREGDPEPIIILCAEASLRAIDNGTKLAQNVTDITASWQDRVKARTDSAVWPVLKLLASRPVVNAAVLESELGLDYMRMKRAMDTLTEAGITVGVDKFKRGRFWRAPEILQALDAFAERAGRRQHS